MTSPLCRRVLEHEWKLYVERLKKTTDELDCVIATAEAVFQKYNYRMNHLRSTYQEDNEDRMDRGQVGKTLKEIEKSVLKTVLKSHRPDFEYYLKDLAELFGIDKDHMSIQWKWKIVKKNVVLDITVPDDYMPGCDQRYLDKVLDSRTIRFCPLSMLSMKGGSGPSKS